MSSVECQMSCSFTFQDESGSWFKRSYMASPIDLFQSESVVMAQDCWNPWVSMIGHLFCGGVRRCG